MEAHPLHAFHQEYEAAQSPEDKLQVVNQFIRRLVEQTHSHTPLSLFWKIREHATPLFSAETAPQIRKELWHEYRQLCQEFRRVRALADEQAQFAAEQIQLTISALERELAAVEEIAQNQEDLPLHAQTLSAHIEDYQAWQKELNFLNIYASRITALRKELTRLEMRPRLKHKLFAELSVLGELVFPRRKEMIKAVSDLFIADVAHFIQTFFPLNFRSPLFELREEVKELQLSAKILTLNTSAFTETRIQLSECWEALREAIRNKRQEQQERRQQEMVLLEPVEELLRLLLEEIEAGQVTEHTYEDRQRPILDAIEGLPIHRMEKKNVKERLFSIMAPFVEKQEQQQILLKEQAEAAERARQQRVHEYRAALEAATLALGSNDLENTIAQYDELVALLQALPATKNERALLERGLRPIREWIAEDKERALLHLSEDDLQLLQQLRIVLQQRFDRRKEIKAHIEELRRGQSGSNLTFERALAMNELLSQERERLEKLDLSIREIEDKIAEFASKTNPSI